MRDKPPGKTERGVPGYLAAGQAYRLGPARPCWHRASPTLLSSSTWNVFSASGAMLGTCTWLTLHYQCFTDTETRFRKAKDLAQGHSAKE